MKLRPQQIIGVIAVIVFGAILFLRLTEKKEDPLRHAMDTSQVLEEMARAEQAEMEETGYRLEAAPRKVSSAIDYQATGLLDARDSWYCTGVLMLEAGDENDRLSPEDQARADVLTAYGNLVAEEGGIDATTSMIARQQQILQVQYDLEAEETLLDLMTCRILARRVAPEVTDDVTDEAEAP